MEKIVSDSRQTWFHGKPYTTVAAYYCESQLLSSCKPLIRTVVRVVRRTANLNETRGTRFTRGSGNLGKERDSPFELFQYSRTRTWYLKFLDESSEKLRIILELFIHLHLEMKRIIVHRCRTQTKSQRIENWLISINELSSLVSLAILDHFSSLGENDRKTRKIN